MNFVRAQEALAHMRPLKANRLVERGASYLGVEAPSPVLLVEFNLTVAGVAIWSADGPRALQAAEIALGQLRAGQGKFREMDRRYLTAYAEALVAYCEEWRDGTDAIRHVNVTDIDFGRVNDAYKRSYPLPPSGALRVNISGVQAYTPRS